MRIIEKIWLIDEDQDDMQMYLEALGELGITCPVECYDNPVTAITRLRQLPGNPRLLLVVGDRMPILHGLDFLQLLYSECLLSRHEAIFFHGILSPPDQDRIAMLKVRSFEKPGSFRDLKAIFRQLLRDHPAAA